MTMNPNRVMAAKPYVDGQLGSFGRATYMLLKQFQFPDFYSPEDQITSADHDRCMQWDYDHASRCFKQHTGTGECGLEYWLKGAKDEDVIAFLVDILKADPQTEWTGYRILGSVHRGNGYPVWTLQLFAKHPNSDTVVYSGPDAPNVSLDRDNY